MIMDGAEHTQLLEKLAEIKKDVAVNTTKTEAVDSQVREVKAELKDIRLSFVTHSEIEARFKILKDDMTGVDNKHTNISNDHENRVRRIEYWGGIAFGLMLALQFYFNYLKK